MSEEELETRIDYSRDFWVARVKFFKDLEQEASRGFPLTSEFLLEYQEKFVRTFLGCKNPTAFAKYTHSIQSNWSFSFASYVINEGICGTLYNFSPLHEVTPIAPRSGNPSTWVVWAGLHKTDTPGIGDLVVVADEEKQVAQIEFVTATNYGNQKSKAIGGFFTKKGMLCGNGVYEYPRDYTKKFTYTFVDMTKVYNEYIESLRNHASTSRPEYERV